MGQPAPQTRTYSSQGPAPAYNAGPQPFGGRFADLAYQSRIRGAADDIRNGFFGNAAAGNGKGPQQPPQQQTPGYANLDGGQAARAFSAIEALRNQVRGQAPAPAWSQSSPMAPGLAQRFTDYIRPGVGGDKSLGQTNANILYAKDTMSPNAALAARNGAGSRAFYQPGFSPYGQNTQLGNVYARQQGLNGK